VADKIVIAPLTAILKLENGKYAVKDAPGLRLIVRGNSRVWEFRYTMRGETKERYFSLGPHSTANTYHHAKRARDEAAELVRRGICPREDRDDREAAARLERIKAAEMLTYRQFVLSLKGGLPKAPRSRAAMLRYGLDILGDVADKRPADITFTDLKTALAPHWAKRGVIVESVKYISRFLKLAQNDEQITDPNWRNPASLARLTSKNGDLPEARHRKALALADLPDLLAKLRMGRNDAGDGLTFLIVEMIILTALRSAEVTRLRWSYVDRERAVLAIPRDCMKGDMVGADKDVTHFEVPLTQPMIRVLDRAKFLAPPKTDDAPIFPSPVSKKGGGFFYDGTVLDVLETLGFRDPEARAGDKVTIHGFRSLFVGWARAQTRVQLDDKGQPIMIDGEAVTDERWSKSLIQMCLAHVEKDETNRAYDRQLPVAPRRGVMQAWNAFCEPQVVQLEDRRPALAGGRVY
jgi:integrase